LRHKIETYGDNIYIIKTALKNVRSYAEMAEKIEKKISRIMRWLERCALACRGESYGSALMDIECARVDFDSARNEIWNTVQNQYNPVSKKIYFKKFFRTVIASAAILLSAAAPLSFLENTFSAITTNNSLEWVNSDEKALLKNIREQLSNANSGWITDLTDIPVVIYSESSSKLEVNSVQNSSLPDKPKQMALANHNFVDEKPLKNSKTDIKNEAKIFSLIKIGENALRGKPSAVIVER
jgi:hypothetical protein